MRNIIDKVLQPTNTKEKYDTKKGFKLNSLEFKKRGRETWEANVSRFMHLNIAKKMLLGYLGLAVLIFLISAFTLSSLDRINDINSGVIKADVPLIDATEKMIDNLLAQELYAKRYLILKSPEILELFWEKSREFDSQVAKIRTLPGLKKITVDHIAELHAEYNDLFDKGIQQLRDTDFPLVNWYDAKTKKTEEELIGLIKNISLVARQNQKEKTILTSNIGTTAFRVTGILCIIGIISSVGVTILITRSIAGPISQLKLATQEISEGKYDHLPQVRNQDELGDLANAFNIMAQRLKRLEEISLDSSPLTRLPGSAAIENVLKKKLETGAPFAFCLIDMDNFKAFNDKYGYATGSEVIKTTAEIIERCVTKHGAQEDFVGHIGGDDFVLITNPDRFREICNTIIETFDKKIPEFYDSDDLHNGYIIAKTRQGQDARFPIMTISIAVVTNQQIKLSSTVEVGEMAAELKEYAKSISGSIYVVNRRRKNVKAERDENVVRFPKKASNQKDI
ncbi:MAG: diguanylate cyclase [Thermodesulfovibrionia bacterium]|nr:diguanylate cyclase [Thermodesulfovibrionia bacterium]